MYGLGNRSEMQNWNGVDEVEVDGGKSVTYCVVDVLALSKVMQVSAL